jgi:hypothetical protein
MRFIGKNKSQNFEGRGRWGGGGLFSPPPPSLAAKFMDDSNLELEELVFDLSEALPRGSTFPVFPCFIVKFRGRSNL